MSSPPALNENSITSGAGSVRRSIDLEVGHIEEPDLDLAPTVGAYPQDLASKSSDQDANQTNGDPPNLANSAPPNLLLNAPVGPVVRGPTNPQRQATSDPAPEVDSVPSRKDAVSEPIENGSKPPEDVPLDINEYKAFWIAYNADAEAEDKEIVEILGDGLGNLLIFAGLFSASNVAFIIESYKDLRKDKADTTNDILLAILQKLADPDSPLPSLESKFAATGRAVRVNALFFASLSCSLFTAFGAVIAKQWLNHYKKEGKRWSPAKRGRERQRKYMGLDTWHLEQVVETLPTLLQFSLFFFLAALVDFIWPFNITVASVILAFSVVTFLFYLVTLCIGAIYPSSPFQTRFSHALRKIITSLPVAKTPFKNKADIPEKHPPRQSKPSEEMTEDDLNVECILWVLETSGVETALSVAAMATLMLPEESRVEVSVLNEPSRLLRLLLQPKASGMGMVLGVSVEALRTMLVPVCKVLKQWDRESDIVLPSLRDNTMFICAVEEILARLIQSSPLDYQVALNILSLMEVLIPTDGSGTPISDNLFGPAIRMALTPTSPHHESRAEKIRSFLGSITYLEEPVDSVTLQTLTVLDCGDRDVALLCEYLSWAFGATNQGKEFKPAHSFVRSFLTDPIRSLDMRIILDAQPQQTTLAIKCLNIMNSSLSRNILQQDNPIILNKDIGDLESKIGQHIPRDLQYACRHWGKHLKHASPLDQTIRVALMTFCQVNLLPWFEVLSLIGCMEDVWDCLVGAEVWIKANGLPGSWQILLRDANRLGGMAMETMTNSAASTYSVALPLTYPSILYDTYSVDYGDSPSSSLKLRFRGEINNWSTNLRSIGSHLGRILGIEGSPDGLRVMTHSTNGDIGVWECMTGICVWRSKDSHTQITCATYSADGLQIVLGFFNGAIQFWDAITGNSVATLSGDGNMVKGIAISPDAKYLATTSESSARLWDVASKAHIADLKGHEDDVSSISFSPDSLQIASGSYDSTVRVWEVTTRSQLHVLRGHELFVTSVAFSPKSDVGRVASGSWDATINLWDAHLGTLLHTLKGHTAAIRSVAFSPDGAMVGSTSDDHTIRIWNTELGSEPICTLDCHTRWVMSAKFSRDGKFVLSGSDDQAVRLWDVSVISLGHVSRNHSARVSCISLSPNKQMVASGSKDCTIRLWNADSGLHIHTLSGHTDQVNAVAFCPDGKRTVSASDDRTARIWDTESGLCVATLEGHSDSVLVVAVSPDGLRVVTGSKDHSIRLWDAISGSQITEKNEHSDWVMSVAFSPDGFHVISGSEDTTVRIWNADTLDAITTLQTAPSFLAQHVSYSLDGKNILARQNGWGQTIWDSQEYRRVEFVEDTGDFELKVEGDLVVHQTWSGPRKEVCYLPIPNITAAVSNGNSLIVGTRGGQLVSVDFAEIL